MLGMRTDVRLNGSQVHSFETDYVLWLGTDDKPHNLKVGDVLEIEITGIGLLRNRVIAQEN